MNLDKEFDAIQNVIEQLSEFINSFLAPLVGYTPLPPGLTAKVAVFADELV